MTRRLILVCVFLCVAEGLLVGWLVHRGTQRSFEAFVREGAIQSFRATAVAYYESRGSWEGFGEFLQHDPAARGPGGPGGPPPGEGDWPMPGESPEPASRPAPGMGPGQPGRPMPGMPTGQPGEPGRPMPGTPPGQPGGPHAVRPPRYGLADPSGHVVLTDGTHPLGSLVDAAERARAVPLLVGGVERARILVPPAVIEARSPERGFLDQADRALLLAIVLAVLGATIVGAWLASAYTRPLRALTTAASRLARGRLGEQVRGPAHGELGELTGAFNRMSEDLSRADAQRRQLTADVAHELRSPITVLTGYLEAMEQGDLSPTPERIRSMRGVAVGLSRLVEELRTLSLAEAGGLPLQRGAVEPRELLAAVSAAFQPEANARRIELSVEADRVLEAIDVDRERMVQVLSNLVSNALRFTPPGGRVTLGASENGASATFTVRDTGSGIDPATLPHVFERFYRADPSRHESEHSGLGLAIARALVELHGGTIGVESQPGRGTCFTIRIPVQSGGAKR